MKTYSTQQREVLTDYLSEHVDEKLTAKDIEAGLKDNKISISAIYRNLSSLEKENKVKRCIGENNREIYFRYIDNEKCKNSIHLVCKICGKYYHMKEKDEKFLSDCVMKSSGFSIENADSVIYGICSNCRK